MGSIQTALAATRTYDELYLIAKNAEPKLSFWGARFITVKGYEGTLPLDALVKRVSEMVLEKPWYEINNHELLIRGEVRIAIDAIYDKSDQQVKAANCFTKFLTSLRYFRLTDEFTTLRWNWRECDKNRYLPLRAAMTQEKILPNDLIGLQSLSNEPVERTFYGQLREDLYWIWVM